MASDTGILHNRIRVTKKVINFGKPYGSYDIDDWIIKHHALSFFPLKSSDLVSSEFLNVGITAGYVEGDGYAQYVGTPDYDDSLCGFPNQDCTIFDGSFAVFSTQQNPELSGIVSPQCLGVVVQISYDDLSGLAADDVMVLCGVKLTDTGDYRFALTVRQDGTTAVFQNGVFVTDGPRLPQDTPVLVTTSVSATGAVKASTADQTVTGVGAAPTAMTSSTRFDIAGCVESSALVDKAQGDYTLKPFIGQMERVFFSRNALTPRAHLIGQTLITMQTYYDPSKDFESAPSL